MSLALAVLGLAWHALHFGLTETSAAEKLARDVRQLIAERTRQIQSLAERVAVNGTVVDTAETTPESLSALFDELQIQRARTAGKEGVSITVYVPTASRGGYRVLAWSDGAAEDIHERLSGPAAL